MEGVNSFEKGLHRSNSPQEQPEGSYVDALNWIRNDSGRLINEELEEIVQTLPDYTLLGHTPVNDLFICFFKVGTNSEIGTFSKTTGYISIFNDKNHTYKLNFTNSIDCVARVLNTGDIVVYFVEGNVTTQGTLVQGNIPRKFNLTQYINKGSSSTLFNDIRDFNLQLDIKLASTTLEVKTGGSLQSGVYSIVLRYVNDQNNKTVFGIPSRFISIIDDDGTSDTSDGCPPGVQTNKLIRITINNVDTNYLFIEPVIITFDGVANNLVIKSIGIYPNIEGSTILFSDESQLQDSIPTSLIVENPSFYTNAKCIEQKDNILILSNLTGKEYDRSFQAIANDINVCWEEEDIPYSNNRAINFAATPNTPFGKNANDGSYDNKDPRQQFTTLQRWTTPPGVSSKPVFDQSVYSFGNVSTVLSYNKETRAEYNPNETKDNAVNLTMPFKNNELKGFQRGEVYSFSITPIYKDGSVGFAYHIPGKTAVNISGNINRCNYFKSSELYPDYIVNDFPTLGLDTTDNKNYILHHRMPDVTNIGPYDKCSNVYERNIIGEKLTKIKVSFRNINFSPAQKNIIQGFIIGYQPRNSDLNTRIIDTGIAKPYMANGPRYRQTFFNGSNVIIYQNNASMTYCPQEPYCMYYSPDTLLGKKINESYSIQKTGYIKNYIKNNPPNVTNATVGQSYIGLIRNSFNTNPGVINNLRLATDIRAFFEDGGTINFAEDPRKIVKAIEVPVTSTSMKVDGKFELNLSSPYTHIESSATIWGNFTHLDPPQFKLSQSPDVFGFENICNLTSVRILNELSNLYGRLEKAEYAPIGVCYDFTVDPNYGGIKVEVEGDVYISQYWYTIKDGIQLNYDGGSNFNSTQDIASFDFLAGVWVESKNNYSLMHYGSQETSYYPKDKVLYTKSPNALGVTDYDFTKRTLGYNKQYSAINDIKLNFIKPLFFQEVVDFSNRSIYSKQSFETDLVDQYRVFPANNFHDIPKDRGVITDTFVFNNTFFHHTEYGLWQSFFNPNTTQATSQGEITLGNGGIFKIPSKLILDIKGGYMGTLDKSGTNTPFGRVFLDHAQGKIFLFAGEAPVEISDLGLFSYFREFVNTNDKYSMGYDWANKRLLISNITQEKAISFYPKTQTWTSLHEFAPTAYLTLNGSSYAWQDTGTSFYNLSNSNDRRKNSYITFVENTQPDAFKRFDRIEMNTMSGGSGGIVNPGSIPDATNYTFNNNSFTHIHTWTDRQNSTELVFAYSNDYNTNFLNSYDPSKVPVNYYRSSFHAELPLDAVVDPNKNIFDDRLLPQGNLDINTDFRTHMKGKFLYTKLSYKNIGNTIVDKPLVLNYVKTFFKPTVA